MGAALPAGVHSELTEMQSYVSGIAKLAAMADRTMPLEGFELLQILRPIEEGVKRMLSME